MNCLRYRLLLILVHLASVSFAVNDTTLMDDLNARYLVQADITAIRGDIKVKADVTCRISDVYWGPKEIVGSTFTWQYPIEERVCPITLVLPPERGEKGMWFLSRNEEGKLFSNHGSWRFAGRYWPAREKIDPEYSLALEFAKTLRNISSMDTASPAWRTELRRLASHTNASIAIWSTAMLCKNGPESLAALYDDKGVVGELPAASLVILDRWLVLNKTAWKESASRKELLTTAFRQIHPGSSNELTFVGMAMNSLLQDRGLKGEDILDILTSPARNPQTPRDAKMWALNLASRLIYLRKLDGNDGVLVLCLQMLNDADESVALRAARVINETLASTDTRQQQVGEARKKVSNSKVLAELDKFLAKQPAAEQKK